MRPKKHRFFSIEHAQHGFPDEWRIADPATGDLFGPDFRRLFIDTDMDLAPQAALRAPMLAG